jgi:hypothetical protein
MINPDNEFSEGTPLARTRKQYNDIITLCKKRDELIESLSGQKTLEEKWYVAMQIYSVHQEIKALRGDK